MLLVQPLISQRAARFFIVGEISGLRGFYIQLERLSPSSDLSITSHALRVFRSLRTSLGQRVDGGGALEGFLYLLAAAAESVERGHLPIKNWGLSETAQDIANHLDHGTWNALKLELIRGLPLYELRPDFRIVLRHASGPLFQEAHYLAQFRFEEQPLLPGLEIVPEPVTIVPDTEAIGLHFTPPALARTLVEEARALYPAIDGEIRVLDPACGSGEFLREVVRQLRLADFKGKIHLTGWDISSTACAMARFTLAWETRGDNHITWTVEERDALGSHWPEVDLILMNPPFLSVRDMTPDQKEQVRATLGGLAHGRYELASAFIWMAAKSVAEGGVVGAVLPASLLEGESFARIRGAVAEYLQPHLVARLGSQVLFQQARVDAGFYVGRRSRDRTVPTAIWADHRLSSSSAALRTLRRMRAEGGPIDPVDREGFSIYPNPDIGHDERGWAPRPFHEWSFRRKLGGLPTVGDLFTVRQGALTGLNRAFIISRAYWQGLPEPERLYFRPAVINESIVSAQLQPLAYVFFPYAHYQLDDENEVRTRLPTFYNDRLEPHKKSLKNRNLPTKASWWELTRHRAWQVEPKKKLVSTYFGQSGSFAWDEDGEYVVVQGYAWNPKGFGNKPSRALWLAYLALLNSDIFEALLSATSDNVGGGQWNLSIRYVKHIPIPSLPTSGEASRLTGELADIGTLIMQDGLKALDESQLDALRELVESAYGVEGPPVRVP